jgi:hypothetical protein
MKRNEISKILITILTFFTILLITHPANLYAQEVTTLPELVDFCFSPLTVDVAAGAATVIATFHFTDDISGFSNSSVNFRSPSGLQTAGTSARTLISGTANDWIYQSEITIQQFAEEGTWVVSAVHLYDEVGNGVTYLTDELETLGFPAELEVVSEPTIDAILDSFENGVDGGTIEKRGKKPWLANVRLWLFGQMLESTKWLLEHNKIKHACKILKHTYNRCDGTHRPPDFVKGEAVPQLASMISELMCNLECKGCPIKYTAIINYYTEGQGEEERSWIEVQLMDEEGNPMANEKYELYLPDGSVIKGRLDENGIARVSDVEPGTADIAFPDLDTDSWERI